MRSFSYTPRAGFSEEFLLQSWSLFIARSFPYQPDANCCEEVPFESSCHFQEGVSHTLLLLFQLNKDFPLHTSCFVYSWGVSPTLLLLLLMRIFSYTSDAMFIREVFLLHTLCYNYLFVRSFSYLSHDIFIREVFLLHSWYYVYLWGVSLTHFMLHFFVRSFIYTPDAMFIREEFLLHSRCYSYPPHASFSEVFLLHSPY